MDGKLEHTAQETRNGVFFCQICKGQLDGRCVICKQRNSQIRKEFPELTEHWKYIIATLRKLRKFHLPTSGVESIDQDCLSIGDWPKRTLTKKEQG